MKDLAVPVICLLAAALCVVILLYLKLKSASRDAGTDRLTGALTENGFYKVCGAATGGKTSRYAAVSLQIPEISALAASRSGEERDGLLRLVYDSINRSLRKDELIVRMSEDVFCFLIQNRREDELTAKLDSISDAISAAVDQRCSCGTVRPLAGVYLPEEDGESGGELLRKAAMARLGASEKKRTVFYERSYEEKLKRDGETALSIRRALDKGEITVYYQPKVRVSDQKVVGAEALARWRHPHRGVLSPNMFLPIAEEYHLIDMIDRAVFTEVCRGAARRSGASMEACPISVNLSEESLLRPALADELYEICREHNVSPSSIELEFKEDAASRHRDRVASLAEKLHFYGFRCAIDNFGAGDCSLQLLGNLNVDTVKLDSSFFSGENDKRGGRHLVETVLKHSALLRIHTVAEGIDSYAQVEYLKSAACDTVQGFIYFKPMPQEKFESEAYEDGQLRYVEANPTSVQAQKIRQLSSSRSGEEKSSVILFVYKPKDDLISFSDSFSPVLRGERDFENALALMRTTELIHENDRRDFFVLLERCMRETGWVKNTLRFYMSHGRYEWLEIRAHYDADSGIISGMLADMSGWKSEVNRWKEKAIRDALTGLYNRAYFEQNAEKILKQGNHECASFIFVDVDDFKKVNDGFGHMFGDDVLCFVAKQLLGIFRHTDIIARYGGDEFVIFAPSLDRDVLCDRLSKLLETLRFPYRSGSTEYVISVTLGAALYPRDGEDYDTLLNHADCALYEAKEQGKKRYVIYEPHMKGDMSHKTTPIESGND